MKKALLTGITGQDGSYLTEFLLDKGYEVHGMIRRTSIYVRQRIDHLTMDPSVKGNTLFLHYGDMTDGSNISRLVEKIQPDEIYNLAAQSHVKISFDVPEYSAQVDGIGTIRLLDAIREVSPESKFYQASTSELYGLVRESPQTESTPFYPRSPYAAAKLYAYWVTVNYREAYNLYACNGILFNHECFYSTTPVILKQNGEVKVEYISNLVPNRTDITKDSVAHTKDYLDSGLQIWDGTSFVGLKAVSRKKLSALDKADQSKQITNARCGSVSTTPNHRLVNSSKEKCQARNFKEGQLVCKGNMATGVSEKNITPELAEVLGLLAGDGYISENSIRLTNNDPSIRGRFWTLCQKAFAGISFREAAYSSGYGGTTTQIEVSGLGQSYCAYLREVLYDKRTKHKKVPNLILNARKMWKRRFLDGYFAADGLKKDRCAYPYKSFKTNSPLLAQGLLYLISAVTGQSCNINTFEQNDKIYYQINLHSDKDRGDRGKHFVRTSNEVTKILNRSADDQHVFDIETETGVVMAGIGTMIVGNSERRGENFVTRKITISVANIIAGRQEKVSLGNLSAVRDWGHSRDFIESMWLMLQQDEPDDYVIATGENHSVEEFCSLAFETAGMPLIFHGEGLDRKGYDKDGVVRVDVSPEYFRPTEVQTLLGDASKAKRILGWEPKIKFKELVRLMTLHDLGSQDV
jgi:GDPmannose 4,6-dehydratase